MAKLIKIDRNGSKHYEGPIKCERCGGKGYYAIGIRNGQPVLSPHDGGVCWKCEGTGKVLGKWIERTPEYQAKLDARRAAREEKRRAEAEAERAAKEAERAKKEAEAAAEQAQREAEGKARKAISQYIGSEGDKIAILAEYTGSAHYEAQRYGGFGTETMFIHMFKDADGNKLVWKTSTFNFEAEAGELVKLTGTIKEHSEYKDEKQNRLIRCKVIPADKKENARG